jgi:hypothetical protein
LKFAAASVSADCTRTILTCRSRAANRAAAYASLEMTALVWVSAGTVSAAAETAAIMSISMAMPLFIRRMSKGPEPG